MAGCAHPYVPGAIPTSPRPPGSSPGASLPPRRRRGRRGSDLGKRFDVVVLEGIRQIVQIAQARLPQVAVLLVEAMRAFEAGVGPQFHLPRTVRPCMALGGVDEGLREA